MPVGPDFIRAPGPFLSREYNNTRTGYKLLIKPSKDAVNRFKTKVRAEWLRLRSHPIAEVLEILVPIVRGWANYYHTAVSKHTFYSGPLCQDTDFGPT